MMESTRPRLAAGAAAATTAAAATVVWYVSRQRRLQRNDSGSDSVASAATSCQPSVHGPLPSFLHDRAGAVDSSPTSSFADLVSIGAAFPISTNSGQRIWDMAHDRQVTTLAGNGGFSSIDGPGMSASFECPFGVCRDCDGNILVAEPTCIRKLSPNGFVSTLAGSPAGLDGFVDGSAMDARFDGVWGVAVDRDGNVVASDTGNSCIRRVALDGVVSTLAGTGDADFADGPANEARFDTARGVAVDDDGNVIVADTGNHCIRLISPDGIVSTLAGSGRAGFRDGPARSAMFFEPVDVAIDNDGNIVVADRRNHCIRKIAFDLTFTTLFVSTLAGSGRPALVNGPGEVACFCSPVHVAVDGANHVVVADFDNHCIRRVSSDGFVVTLAGSRDFDFPRGVAIDVDGNVIVADSENGRVRKISAGLSSPAQQRRTLMASEVTLRSGSFFQDMRRMFTSAAFADVTFCVDGEEIMAHRSVLAARSEYFAAMLTSEFREGVTSACIPVHDASPVAFRVVLDYLYTDSLVVDDTAALDVLKLADQYSIAKLYQMCTRHCSHKLSLGNVVSWLVQSDIYGLESVRSAAFAFLVKHFGTIKAASPKSLEQLKERPNLMLEVMMQIAST